MYRYVCNVFYGVALLAGLWPCLAVAQIKQETLNAEGFPSAWKASDFAVGTEILSGTVVSSTTGSPTMVLAPVNTSKLDGRGVLNLGTGGESPDVWQKQERGEIEPLMLKALTQGVASPALKEGWRRLLLSEAEPPKITDGGTRAGWLGVRMGALDKLGLYEAAWGLWRGIPAATAMDDVTALGWVEAQLLAGQNKEACELAKSRAVAAGGNSDWAAVMAVCQMVGGGNDPAAARLSLQVVEPALRARNPELLRILTAVQDGRPIANLGGPTAQLDALGGAVLTVYPALVGRDILPRMPDVALRRLATSSALPEDLRGRAAVALARQSALVDDGKLAWNLVSSTDFSGALPDAVVLARGMKDVSGTDIREYVQSALRLDKLDAAAKAMPAWLKQEGLNATQSRERVQAQLVLGALQGRVDERVWDLWVIAQPLDMQTGVRNAQRTLLALEGLGIGVPARIWKQLHERSVTVSSLVDPAWQRLLARAVAQADVAQVLALISSGWAGQPPAGVVPVTMGASIEALRRIGMEDVARRAAVEAVLGIPASHLVQIVPEKQPVAVSATGPVAIGADSLQPVATPPAAAGDVLLPPRVEPVRKPSVVKPFIKMPSKPVAPKAGG